MTLGVDHVLGDPFAVEVGHLLDQVVVLEQQWTLGARRQREFVARRAMPRVVGSNGRLEVLGVGVLGHGLRVIAILKWIKNKNYSF